MAAFLLKRLLLAVPLLLGASLLIFLIFEASGADPVKRLLGERSQDAELVAQLRAEHGLDDPAHVRYFRFVAGAARGDFGRSMRTRRSVSEEIRERFPATLELALSAMMLGVLLGMSAGIVSGLKRNTVWDYGAMTGALLAVSLPVFWVGLLLAWYFGERLEWLPIDQRLSLKFSGAVPERTGLMLVDTVLAGRPDVFRNALAHLVLPAVTLCLVKTALLARMTRSSILEVLQKDFVRTARAKGLGPGRWLYHVLRNALIPVVTIIGLEIPALLGGAVITETIFSWPGIGSYLIECILFADATAVQGIVMFLTMVFILVNIGVDAMYTVIDPRMRSGGAVAEA